MISHNLKQDKYNSFRSHWHIFLFFSYFHPLILFKVLDNLLCCLLILFFIGEIILTLCLGYCFHLIILIFGLNRILRLLRSCLRIWILGLPTILNVSFRWEEAGLGAGKNLQQADGPVRNQKRESSSENVYYKYMFKNQVMVNNSQSHFSFHH